MDWTGLGIRPADILLPRKEYLNKHWPVVALDQYTSQPEIWREAERAIGDAPSTLRLIVPEAFLAETEARSQAVYQAMESYLQRELFDELRQSFVLVERTTQSGSRVGLVLALDLEEYDFRPGSPSLIRATEETVLDRIPPRLKVREQSKLEVPHVMLLVDDKDDSLLGPLYKNREKLPLCYDLDLLMQGGRVRGWLVRSREDLEKIHQTLAKLKSRLAPGGMLFAVGDGNHSLAAAKASWDKQKAGLARDELTNHPARYALVELVNLHSPALLFEPIHRLAFNTDAQAVLAILKDLKPEKAQGMADVTLVGPEGDLPLRLTIQEGALVTEAVQKSLDAAKVHLDYVHGEEALRELVQERHGCGILMPDFPKDRLFPTVETAGRLPRKTFSMGEANEKRFYLEARKITR